MKTEWAFMAGVNCACLIFDLLAGSWLLGILNALALWLCIINLRK